MHDGETVALVSDAGMPLVSDPGFVLVRACVAAGLAVEVLPGPSAALAALVASALPADHWRFAGFLPRKQGELEATFANHETLVAFESPRRVAASLAVLAGARPGAPGRGLPRADQGPRGGGARQPPTSWPRGTPSSRLGARSCSSSGRRRRRDDRISAPRSRRCASWSSPAPSRAPPPVSSPSSRAGRPTRCTER